MTSAKMQRALRVIASVRSMLWFVPALMTIGAMAIALIMVRIDESIGATGRANSPWLFGGGAEGARGVLSAIAGTMMTVAATVFSIMVVALQLASSQFTPRVIGSLMRDRGNQLALGAFIGTFTYSLLVLRSVQSAPEDGRPFVPSASVTLAIVFALVSIALLIYFIHHSARSMQAARIIDGAAIDALRLADRMDADARGESRTGLSVPSFEPAVVVQSARAGYVESIDVDGLVRIAVDSALVVRIEQGIGAHLLPGMVLVSACPLAATVDGERASEQTAVNVEAEIRDAFILTTERGEDQDLVYSTQRLADIALKALSPGINDPTTAMLCIDRLAEIIVRVGIQSPPPAVYGDAAGLPRVLWEHDPFDALVRTSFDGVSHYGAGDARILIYLTQTLANMVPLLPAHRRKELSRQVRLIEERSAGQHLSAIEQRELAVWTAKVLGMSG